jgi:gamma-glutamyltranspeptidase/glutathione hydrolase
MRRHASDVLFAAFLLALAAQAEAQQQEAPAFGPPTLSPATNSGRSTVYAPNAVIATSQPLATSAGLEIMRSGGNAIDAAIAAVAVLNLTEPHMTGMGGDMFAIVWSEREKKLVGINAAGHAGSLMTREELIRRGRTDIPGSGAESVTMPGALAGWDALLKRFGNLTLAQVLEPAARLAEGGFPVSPIIARDWAGQVNKLKRDPAAAHTFLIGGERAPRAGEWFTNPELASTFRQLQREGAAAFYGGSLGRRMVDHLEGMGGFLTYDDLTKVKVEWVDPVGVRFGEYKVYELPPPGQGVAALQMLRLLEPYDL